MFGVRSLPDQNRHIIFKPKKIVDKTQGQFDYLHELTHAYLGETISRHLSSPKISEDMPEEYLGYFRGIFLTMGDWFVNGYIYKICPEAVRLSYGPTYTALKSCGVAYLPPCNIENIEPYILAAQIAATGMVIFNENPDIDPSIRNQVDTLLSIPYDKPSLEAFTQGIETLFRDFGIPLRPYLENDEWKFEPYRKQPLLHLPIKAV